LKNIDTVVIDAGARFGLHPTWKSFSGELKYYMFDPDTIETDRLKLKYASREKEILIFDKPLTKSDGDSFVINYFKNRAMSSSQIRNEVTELFKNQRKDQVKIQSSKTYVGISIDTFCKKNNLNVDFLKLDTEGTEYDILQGAKQQLNSSVLAIRVKFLLIMCLIRCHCFQS
jgi:FkbM family methyltransferase